MCSFRVLENLNQYGQIGFSSILKSIVFQIENLFTKCLIPQSACNSQAMSIPGCLTLDYE